MDSYEIGRLTYLVLLGAAVIGSFFMMNKANLGKSLQQLAIWALIFVGAIGAYQRSLRYLGRGGKAVMIGMPHTGAQAS